MGLNIREIIPRRETEMSELKGKILCVDAFNALYQFLSNIRQPDGTPLMDSKQRVTSHLSGLFYRTTNLMAKGIKLVYVFDGQKSELKQKTIEMREKRKEIAREKYGGAREEGKEDEMFKFSRQTSRLNDEMIEESKQLLEALGLSVIQAPEEGEAQASYMAKHDPEIYAVASQDYDSLLFGAPRLIQNLTLAKKRTLASGNVVTIQPELIEFEALLNHLSINHEQLICLGILVGTDFNAGGVHGIGPKKALALVRAHRYPVSIFEEVQERYGSQDFDWRVIFEMFKKPNVARAELKFPRLNAEKVKEILVKEHDFSLERVEKQLGKLVKIKQETSQRRLF